jgi:hypothetical protein
MLNCLNKKEKYMKVARKVVFGLAVLGIVVFLSGVSFAQTATAQEQEASARKARHEARIKLLQDSAAALRQTHPDLAKSLEEMTVPKQKTEMQKAAKEKNEKEEVGEKVEPKGDK